MKPVTILKRARKLIENPGKWCKGTAAMTRTYKPTDPNSRNARLFCAWGAIARAGGRQVAFIMPQSDNPFDVFEAAVLRPVESFAAWNDAPHRTHKQVLRAFDKAIKLAEAKS